MKYDRVFVVVMDTIKIGQNQNNILNSLQEITEKMEVKYGNFAIPNLKKLGIENLYSLTNNKNNKQTSNKNILTEKIERPFKFFAKNELPDGLAKELEKKFEKKIVSNKSSNASTIVNQLANREKSYDEVIVYTTNSTLNICGNEDKMGLKQLYKYCQQAKEVLVKDDYNIEKIVARPYKINIKNECTFTQNKKEYELKSESLSYLDKLTTYGYDVIAVGKIDPIFENQSINNNPSTNSTHGMEKTIEIASSNFKGVCLTNLLGLNEISGEEKDLIAYGKELEILDVKIGNLITMINHNDLLIITANANELNEVPIISYTKKNSINCDCNLCKYENIATKIIQNFGIDKISNNSF